MSSEGKFWIAVWFVVAFGVVSFTAVIADYWKDHNTKIVKMIEDGVDPVAAMCALQDDLGKHPTCVILATKGGKGI